uniref:TF-B3 domain-containing protein n=1 Tax=Triticum urartu TaxID=4572 RepID=A0A8R7QX70_TRIUA
MIDRHDMKLPKSLSESCGIEADEEGYAGIRLTARGPVTTYAYGVDTGGRTHLSTDGWKSFLVDKNLHVGHAIFIIIRNTNHQGLKMMIVIDTI